MSVWERRKIQEVPRSLVRAQSAVSLRKPNDFVSATRLLQQFEKATAHYVEARNDYLQLRT